MQKPKRIKLQEGSIILLLILLFTNCRKPDQVLPEGPNTINVEATVPALIYSNVKEVYLDASRTISLNSRRAMFFTWYCTSFPAASGLPVIIDSTKPVARVENPGIGQYIFKLKVKDNLGNIAESSYTLDVLQDTLLGKKPIAKAGPDQEINSPQNAVILNASETFSFNAMGRTLTFKWTIIQKPASASEIILTQSTLPTTTVYRLVEGDYKIQLEVKNEFGISGYDTMEIKVLPDPLKGTTRIFEDVVWKRVDDGWGDYIAIILLEPDFFENRFEGNMEVRVWDEEKKEWFDPKKFAWDTNEGFGLRIYYSCLCDQDTYFKMAGVKTRVQVKFL